MKKTIQIDYSDWDIDSRLLDKLKEMEIIEKRDGMIQVKKCGTLVIEFIEE